MTAKLFRWLLLGASTALLAGPVRAAEPSSVESANRIEIWRQSAEKEEPWACFNLGLAYQMGSEIERNPIEAVRLYRMAADKSYAPAQANLGYCYETGFGVSVSFPEAVRWYQLAALQGNSLAQYNLGRKYLSGAPGVPVDPLAAEKWLRLAAQQNFAPAFFSIGQLYAGGALGAADYEKAHTWFLQAAQQGYPPAQHAIGFLYTEGKGVPQSFSEAVKWYGLAASRNYPDSHYNLGYCYERGRGVPQNLTTAVNHYRTAAELGHVEAQYTVGVCYYEGKGVQVDLVEAYKWWNLAASQGIPEAASSKEILARLLSPQQVHAGQKAAEEFVPRVGALTETARFVQPTTLQISDLKRTGTGFFISSDGYILTTYQTIQGASSLQVLTEAGSFSATLHKVDPLKNIALLKVSGVFHPLPLVSSLAETEINSSFSAVGFERLTLIEFNPKVAKGKVTALSGYQSDPRQISMAPPVGPTFFGSAIVSERGQVLAMLVGGTETSPAEGQETATAATRRSFGLKSDHLISFLKAVPEAKPVLASETGGNLSPPEEIVSKARAAAALILAL